MTDDIGFTGSRAGMTVDQAVTVLRLLKELNPERVHHGMQFGADTQFHYLVKLFFDDVEIYGYPPSDVHFNIDLACRKIMKPERALVRNEDIVLACGALIATPAQVQEILRSGTWATIRRMRAKGGSLAVIWPSGVISQDEENPLT